jgi:hypothetical protein
MITYRHLTRYPNVFRTMTGLRVNAFDDVVADLEPRYAAAEEQRLQRPGRQRAIGGGPDHSLSMPDQILLTVIWLRLYPIHEVLAYLFGTSDSTVSRVIERVLPLLEASGRDSMRRPDPGRKRRRQLDQVLAAVPELNVIIDTFEQRVQRPRARAEADTYYSGKKKAHTLKSQIVGHEVTGEIVDLAPSVRGPTADITLLKESQVLDRLPPGVGALGDLAYVGLAAVHPAGLGFTPRRKPRDQDRPVEDVIYNRAFARRRSPVEHTIGRLRHYQALAQRDRHHRRHHTARTRAVAGLVNRQLRARWPGC